MSIRDTVRDRLLGPGEGTEREYRCGVCQSTFRSQRDPTHAACPGCGAHQVREA